MLYRYRLFDSMWNDAGEAQKAVLIQPGETILTDDGRTLRVLELVPTEDAEQYVGLFKVETA